MKQQIMKFPMSKYILAGAALLMGITLGASCNSSGDKKDTPVDTSSVNNNTMSTDTNMNNMTSTTGTMPMDTSKAKPNPAKKGGKGKVTVAQQKSSTATMTMDQTGIYNNAEVLPMYPGGYMPMSDYFSSNIEYPQDATDNGIEGTVDVNFAVDETGKLSSAKVVSPRLGYGLEEEALRVVNKMPTWTPGKIKGKNVKTYYTLPIRFELN